MFDRNISQKRFTGIGRVLDASPGDEDVEPPDTRRVLSHACPGCEFTNPHDHRFCLNCGIHIGKPVVYARK